MRYISLVFIGLLMPLTLIASSDRPLKSPTGDLVSPANDGDIVFVVAGDNRPTAHGAPPPRVVQTIFDEIRLIRPEFVIWSGDVIYGYSDTPAELSAEYDAFLASARRIAVPFFNAPGNHEIHGSAPCTDRDSEQQFIKHFGALYGSFDYRGAHFIALDTEQCGHVDAGGQQIIDGPQLDWLKNDLDANKGARAIFIFCHTEMTPAPNDEEGKSHKPLGNSAELHELFRKYPVRAVFQGHEHVYYAKKNADGIDYFVSGGAGAPLYATPDNGGFSHYTVVTLKGNQLTYAVVEPGRLYGQPAASGSGKESLVWLINSTDSPLPVGRLETTVPAALGRCEDLVAENRLTNYKHVKIDVPVSIVGCTTHAKKHDIVIRVGAPNAPARTSVPIYVHKRTGS